MQKLKDVTLKNEAWINYIKYRKLLSTLMKESKTSYFRNYFQNSLNDLKSMWKGIKIVISLKELPKWPKFNWSTRDSQCF